jgi:hypothetical protein
LTTTALFMDFYSFLLTGVDKCGTFGEVLVVFPLAVARAPYVVFAVRAALDDYDRGVFVHLIIISKAVAY